MAKPVVSALVGIAIADGDLGSVDDPVTRYLPELAAHDPRFDRITLRHLLTMSAGLADQDPYYDLDLDQRAAALRHTQITGSPGERFRYNNITPLLVGMALERATGRSVSAYLEGKLWGPPRHGGRRLLEPGQPGVGVGAAAGRPQRPRHRPGQARRPVPARQFLYVAPEQNTVLVRFGTEYNYAHWPELLATLARRL